MEIGKVITLDDNKDYLLLEKVELNHKEYLYAASMKSNIFFKARRDNHYCVEALGIINGFQNKNAGGILWKEKMQKD